MKNKVFLTLFSFILLLSLVLVGCAGKTTTVTTGVTSTAVSTSTVYELTVAYGDNSTEFSDVELNGWKDALESASNGRLKITTIYFAGQLIADAEIYDAAARGTVDIAINTVSQTPNRWSVMDTLGIAPFGSPCQKLSAAYMEVFNKYHSVFDQQFKDTKILAIHGTVPDPPGLPIGSVSKPIRSLADLKGFKMCGPGAYNVSLMSALGAAPTMIPPPEQYDALQKGLLDGCILDPIFYDMLNFKDLIKYQTSNLSFAGGPWFMVMNLAKFNSLPKDLQDILVSTAPVLGEKRDTLGVQLKKEIVDNAVKNNGLQIIEIPQAELDKMIAIEKPIRDAQIAEYAKLLPQASEIFEAYVAARAKN